MNFKDHFSRQASRLRRPALAGRALRLPGRIGKRSACPTKSSLVRLVLASGEGKG
jgi:hypothetical protein